jgi:hypothetical protein
MKSIILLAAVVLLSTTACQSQINNAKTETVKVYGNCGMCETTIEKAANKKKISKADWNEETKMASITYDSKKTTLDAVLKNIALTIKVFLHLMQLTINYQAAANTTEKKSKWRL